MKWQSCSELIVSACTNLCGAAQYRSSELVNASIALMPMLSNSGSSGAVPLSIYQPTKESPRVTDLRLPLTSEDIARLKRSYISHELALDAGLFRVDSAEGGRLVGQNGSRDYSGIAFPYRWPGEPNAREYRLRRDNPEIEELPDGARKEKHKYLSPPRARNLLYFAPCATPHALNDVTLTIVITEGEKKTLALSRLAWLDVTN